MFPVQNQTFQQKNFSGYEVGGSRRIAASSFDARVSARVNDTLRDPWNTDESLYGPNFAVLDGVGMRGTGQSLESDGTRTSPGNSIDFSAWQIDCGDGMTIQGGRGAYLRCPIELSSGNGVRFVWRFGTSLTDPEDKARDYVGFAIVRFLNEDLAPVGGSTRRGYDLLCTSSDLPGLRSFSVGMLQTNRWRPHDLIYTEAVPLSGYVEWIVSSGHLFQRGLEPDHTKAQAYPCCLAIDHIVLI